MADKAFFSAVEEQAFFEATRCVTNGNKEALATMFELAVEAECTYAFACIERSREQAPQMIRSFISVGFTLLQDHSIMPGFYLLAYQL